jgi:hypothetical protein|nr:MAG TPA: hypothetical protein [Caudoviricetes sp.]
MLCLIRFSGTDYIAHLSFREFVDATCARDFYGPAMKLTDMDDDVFFRPIVRPAYMRDEKVAYVAYERMLVSAYNLDEDTEAMLHGWNIEEVKPLN